MINVMAAVRLGLATAGWCCPPVTITINADVSQEVYVVERDEAKNMGSWSMKMVLQHAVRRLVEFPG